VQKVNQVSNASNVNQLKGPFAYWGFTGGALVGEVPCAVSFTHEWTPVEQGSETDVYEGGVGIGTPGAGVSAGISNTPVVDQLGIIPQPLVGVAQFLLSLL
jgi:hypothetical protein